MSSFSHFLYNLVRMPCTCVYIVGANDRVMAFTTAYNAITKGKRRKEEGEGEGTGKPLLQSATAAYKSYAPVRPSDRRAVRWLVLFDTILM